jgi:RHS repeat-associated protein
VTAGSGSQTFTYDLNGNMTSDGARTFEWDAVNRLVAINYTGTNPLKRSEFTYNGIGQRVKQIEKEGTNVTSEKQLLWCQMNLREERNASDQVTKRYYSRGMVTGSTVPAASGSKFYYTRDHLGSIREMADSTAVVRARYDYDPFGRRTKLSGDMDADFGYTGHYFHEPSKLHIAFYRAYDADLGRWLNRDPLKNAERVEGPNLYAYVRNRPTSLTDPFGLCPACRNCSAEHKECLAAAEAEFVNKTTAWEAVRDEALALNDAEERDAIADCKGWGKGSLGESLCINSVRLVYGANEGVIWSGWTAGGFVLRSMRNFKISSCDRLYARCAAEVASARAAGRCK